MSDPIPAGVWPRANDLENDPGPDFPTPSWAMFTTPTPDNGKTWTGIALPQGGTLWVFATGNTPAVLSFVPQGDAPQPIPMNTAVSFQAETGDGIIYAFESGTEPVFQLNWAFA